MIEHPDKGAQGHRRSNAAARAHGAAVATRNVADFSDCGIDVIDPWRA
jgi:hypothetical protein